jgi:hypothetical protein
MNVYIMCVCVCYNEQVASLKKSNEEASQSHLRSVTECEDLKNKCDVNEKQLNKFRKGISSIKVQVESSFMQHHANSARRSVSSHVGDGGDDDEITVSVCYCDNISSYITSRFFFF